MQYRWVTLVLLNWPLTIWDRPEGLRDPLLAVWKPEVHQQGPSEIAFCSVDGADWAADQEERDRGEGWRERRRGEAYRCIAGTVVILILSCMWVMVSAACGSFPSAPSMIVPFSPVLMLPAPSWGPHPAHAAEVYGCCSLTHTATFGFGDTKVIFLSGLWDWGKTYPVLSH